MKFCSIATLFLFNFIIVSGQDTLLLHPAIDKLIDKETKHDYLLFPEIKDSAFKYCYITRKENRYSVTTLFVNDSSATKEVAATTLQQYQDNITKLLEYYANKAKNDSMEKTGDSKAKANDYSGEKVNKNLAAPALNQQTLDEIRRDTRIREDAQRMKDYQQGLGPGPVNIELFSTGKKK